MDTRILYQEKTALIEMMNHIPLPFGNGSVISMTTVCHGWDAVMVSMDTSVSITGPMLEPGTVCHDFLDNLPVL